MERFRKTSYRFLKKRRDDIFKLFAVFIDLFTAFCGNFLLLKLLNCTIHVLVEETQTKEPTFFSGGRMNTGLVVIDL